ncbi:MAG: type II toxin-antitoxin system PemK/MazF family toxin [Legionellaceae bacterium]|nr:type II toxin-antitoxin system PemK/MazF family toxin [Legionellaceae bacterium]
MKRGEIYFADLDPTIGHEIKKRRPVLIVSNNASNKSSDLITIVPITSNISKVYPFEVFLTAIETDLPKDSKAQCHQIRTISKSRIEHSKRAGYVQQSMDKIQSALKLHLDLE